MIMNETNRAYIISKLDFWSINKFRYWSVSINTKRNVPLFEYCYKRTHCFMSQVFNDKWRAGDMNLDCLEADCRNLNHPKTPLQVYHLVSLWVMFSVFIGYVNKCLLLAASRTKIKRTSRFKIVQFLIFSNAIKSTFWWERQRECQLVSMSMS